MKFYLVPFIMMSSLALVPAGCATDEADDLSTSDDALLTCGGVHCNPGRHRGHRHHRHRHGRGHHHHCHGNGGAGGMTTGAAGSTGSGGSSMTGTGGSDMTGTGGSDMTGTGGSDMTGTGGTGMPTDPRCVPIDGMVSWWHADTDYDDAVGANDGDTGGAVAFAAGIDQQAFSLNGTMGSYVEVPNDPTLQFTNAITIDAWINTSVFGGRIVDKITAFGSDGFLLDLGNDAPRILVGNDSLWAFNAHVPAGIWTHVAGTFDGTTLALYLNGVFVGSQPVSPHGVPINANPLRIGADSTGGSLFSGMIDEPRIFSRALSATEIETLVWQTTNCP